MNPVIWCVTGALIFANTIIALPYDGNRFPTTEEVIQRLSTLEYRLSLKILQHTDKCAVEWNGICFFALFYHPHKANQEAARLACDKRGAQLANIYAEDQYDDIMEYLRPYIAARNDGTNWFSIRTGMRYEPKSRIIYLSDGTKAPFVHWGSGYPQADSRSTTVLVHVYPEGSTANGMLNMGSSGGFAALCQINI